MKKLIVRLFETDSDDFKEKQNYFMEEGCAIFSFVLYKMLGKGEFYFLVEPRHSKNEFGKMWDIIHVVLNVDGKFYDSYGERPLEIISEDFNSYRLQLNGPYTEQELKKFMGNSDTKPLYGPTKDTIEMAKQIINKLGIINERGYSRKHQMFRL